MAKNGRNPNGTFAKGSSEAGRRKGSKNKFTTLKASFLEAYQALDGTRGFIEWVKESKRNKELFYGWITKMLPSNVDVDLSGDVKTENKVTVEVIHVKSRQSKDDEADNK